MQCMEYRCSAVSAWGSLMGLTISAPDHITVPSRGPAVTLSVTQTTTEGVLPAIGLVAAPTAPGMARC
jgi:hypothetical protein